MCGQTLTEILWKLFWIEQHTTADANQRLCEIKTKAVRRLPTRINGARWNIRDWSENETVGDSIEAENLTQGTNLWIFIVDR